MIAGSPQLDLSDPKAKPVTGYVPDKSITLVRNPSWSDVTDHLRGAYVDRIDVSLGGDPSRAAHLVGSDRFDLVLGPDSDPTPVIDAYQRDPTLRRRLVSGAQNATFYIGMNLAQPPFDDLHVRRAVNYAIDKAALVRIARVGRGLPHGRTGQVATHMGPDSEENGLLIGYDPYATPGSRGSLTDARAEMRRSRYDRDGDGVCAITPSAETSSSRPRSSP
jgi:peptide/nickel transport system substrate-binding protein